MGGDGLWSNPSGRDWTLNGVLANSNNYPGMAGSANDTVLFPFGATTACRLDVALASSILNLRFSAWVDTLTLSNDLQVTGGLFDRT
jgi:hypothetical protein